MLQTKKRTGFRLAPALLEFTKQFARSAKEGVLSNLEVKGFTSKHFEDINVLNTLIVEKKSILKLDANSRAVESISAYEAIEASFISLKEDILKAASILDQK